MSRVFISYRRDDSKWIARALKDRLCEELGSNQVFMDVDSIEPGLDFVDVIEQAVSKVDVVLAIVGKRWLNASTEDGKRRLDNPEDFVRVEIATALKRDIRLIPLLERGAVMPTPDELPEDLRGLTRRNAIEISDIGFTEDVNRLIGTLKKVLELEKQRKTATPATLGVDPNILQDALVEAAAASREPVAVAAPQPIAAPAQKTEPAQAPTPTPRAPRATRESIQPARASRISPLALLLLMVVGIGLALGAGWMFAPDKVIELAATAGLIEQPQLETGQVAPPPATTTTTVTGDEDGSDDEDGSGDTDNLPSDNPLDGPFAADTEEPSAAGTETGLDTQLPEEGEAATPDEGEPVGDAEPRTMGHGPPDPLPGVESGTLKGVAFEDRNANGKHDHQEPGLANVTFQVTAKSGDSHRVTTDDQGRYEIKIPAGEAVVTIDDANSNLPPGAVRTGTPDDEPLKLVADQITTLDLGFQRQGIVEGVVYTDANGNGKQDPDEAGIPALKVSVMKSDGTHETLVTDEHGLYCKMVPIGETCVALEGTIPAGMSPGKSIEEPFEVPAGGKGIKNISLNLKAPQGLLKIVIFDDQNGDGVQTEGEAGIPEIRVAVLRNDQTIDEWKKKPLYLTSDSQGVGQVDFQPGGCFLVVDTKNKSLQGATLTTAGKITIDVIANQDAVCSFGFQRQGTIEGFVFHDQNNNGAKDAGEAGLGQVNVVVHTEAGKKLDLTTDNNGQFRGNLSPGKTTINVKLTAGTRPTHAVLVTKLPQTVDVRAATKTISHVAFRPTGVIQGIVFHDLNGDGSQQANEKGIKNVSLKIQAADGSSQTATTDTNGVYEVRDLTAGKATFEADLKQAALAGSQPTKNDAIAVVAGKTIKVHHAFRKAAIEVSTAGKSMADYQKLLSQAKSQGVPFRLVLQAQQFTIFQSRTEGGQTINLRKGDKLTITQIDPAQRLAYIDSASAASKPEQSVKTWIGVDYLTSAPVGGAPNPGNFAPNNNNNAPRNPIRNIPLPFPRLR